MKKLLTLAATAALLICAGRTFAQTLDGPVPQGHPWKWALGAGYQRSEAEYRPTYIINGTSDPTMSTQYVPYIANSERIKQNRVYLRATYTLGKNWDIGVHAGVGDLSSNGYENTYIGLSNTKVFTGAFTGYGGISFRGCFYRGEKFAIGVVGQGSLFSTLDETQKYSLPTSSSTTGTPPNTTTSTWTGNGAYHTQIEGFRDGQVALAISVKVGATLIYGGPLYYRSSGRARIDNAWIWTNTVTTTSTPPSTTVTIYNYNAPTATSHFRANRNIGAYLGARLASRSDWSFNMEGGYRGGFTIGFGITRTY